MTDPRRTGRGPAGTVDQRQGPLQTAALETGTPGAPPALRSPVVVRPDRRSRHRTVALRVVVPAGMFGLWWLLTGTGVVTSTDLATPSATATTFWRLLTEQDLLGDIGVSAARLAVGLAIGAGLGLILGTAVGLSRLAEELLDSSLQMLRTIPFPAVIFLFIVWLGIEETAKVALIGLATLFPMYLNASNGVRNVDRRTVEAARSFGLHGRRLVQEVVLPAAFPSILTGLRYSAGVGVVALVFAETINANEGIGYLVVQASSFQQVATVMVCIVLYALLGILVDLVVRLMEWQLMPWRSHVAVR